MRRRALRKKLSGHFGFAALFAIASPFPPFPNPTRALSCTFCIFFLAALPGEIRLLQRAGGRHTQPRRVHRGAEVGAFYSALQATLSSSSCRGAASTRRGFLQPEGSFCSWRLSLSLSRSDAKAQPVLFGAAGPCPAPAAGCRLLAPGSRCFICLLWPGARLAIKSAGRPSLGTAGRCQGEQIASACLDFF